jgi:xanthine dehydrogenase iron-sulfur cluster and FAD-binding subunit A
MGEAVAKKGTVVLAVNGKRYEAAGVDPSTTLLEFLRTQTPVRGPKLGCGEGTYVHPGASSCARIICAQAISRVFFPP